MPNVIPKGEDFRFKDLPLHGYLVEAHDACKPRLAIHEYPKKDGCNVEKMGTGPERFRFRICFVGDKMRQEYQALRSSVNDDCKGLLVHPLLGKLKVACEGWDDAALNLVQAVNCIELTVGFVVDSTDTRKSSGTMEGVTAKDAKVGFSLSRFTGYAALVQTAADALVTSFSSAFGAVSSAMRPNLADEAREQTHRANEAAAAVTTFRESTLAGGAAGASSTPLDAVAVSVAAYRTAVLAVEYVSPTTIHDAVSAAEVLLSDCEEMDEAVALERPVVIDWTVPSTMHLAAIASQLYGADAQAHIDELQTMNVIANPTRILGGTVLRVVQP